RRGKLGRSRKAGGLSGQLTATTAGAVAGGAGPAATAVLSGPPPLCFAFRGVTPPPPSSLLDPRGDVLDHLHSDVPGTEVFVGLRFALALLEEVIEVRVTLQCHFLAPSKRLLPAGEVVHRHLVIALALKNQQRHLELRGCCRLVVAGQRFPVRHRNVEWQLVRRRVL